MSRISKGLGAYFVEHKIGSGCSNGVGGFVVAGVSEVGGLVKTEILVDLTGLNDGGTIADIIGVDGGAVNSHLGQIRVETHGTIIMGTLLGIEAPTGGDPDINLYSAPEGSLAQDSLITASGGEALLLNGGDMTAASNLRLTALPANKQYLYMACGTNTAADYTAGQFLLTLWGQK